MNVAEVGREGEGREEGGSVGGREREREGLCDGVYTRQECKGVFAMP